MFTASPLYGGSLISRGLAVSLNGSVVPLRRKKMVRIRAGSGLGDAIYLRCVAQALLATGRDLEVACAYHEVFHGLPVRMDNFSRERIDIIAHYTSRKQAPGTSQFQDMCIAAGLPPTVPLAIAWSLLNEELVRMVLAAAEGRRVVLVHGGRTPMGRTDGFGAELLPTAEAMAMALGLLPSNMFLVQVGKGPQLYPLECHLDLRDKTSVKDLFDLMSISYGAVAQCSFIIPLAESLSKPLLVVWSTKGLAARDPFVSSVRPEKILHNKSSTSLFTIDNWDAVRVKGMTDAFCNL